MLKKANNLQLNTIFPFVVTNHIKWQDNVLNGCKKQNYESKQKRCFETWVSNPHHYFDTYYVFGVAKLVPLCLGLCKTWLIIKSYEEIIILIYPGQKIGGSNQSS